MAWFKVDDGLHASRKLLSIPKRARFAAVGLWTIAGSWSADQLTDGTIPDYMLDVFGAPPSAPQALVDAGLWEREQGSYVFRNWHEYQPSKQDVDAERAASRERMREIRARRKQPKQPEQREEGEVFGRTGPNSSESVRNPDPTQSRPDPTYIDSEAKASGGQAAEPPLFGMEKPAMTERNENAGTIISAWMDTMTGPRPPGKVIGQLSKEIKLLLDEGHPYAEVREATLLWATKGAHPGILASVLHEVRNPRTMTRGSEERLNVGKSLFERASARTDITNEFPLKELTQ